MWHVNGLQWQHMTTLFQHFGQHLTCSCRCEQSQNGITLLLLRFIRGFWVYSRWKFIQPRKNPAVFVNIYIYIYNIHILKPFSSPFCVGYNDCFKLSCMMLSLTFAAPSGFLGVELLSRQGQRLDRGFVGVLALLHQPSGAGHGCSTNDKPNT